MGNHFKTGALLVVMTSLFLFLGFVLGGQSGMFIALIFAGAIMWIATMARFSAFFGGSDDEEGGLGFVGVMVVSMLAPVAAMVVQMAVSRSREYLADATAAQITGNPGGLANPLFGRKMMHLFSTHPPIEERVARLTGTRFSKPGAPGGGKSGTPTMEDQGKTFWDNMS